MTNDQQIKQLKDALIELQEKNTKLSQDQAELRSFILEFEGSRRADFDKMLKSYSKIAEEVKGLSERVSAEIRTLTEKVDA
jgi:hypothetical protein